MILLFVSLHSLDFLLILSHLVLPVSNEVSKLHLLLNQVLGLGKRPNKLVLFFFLHGKNFVLVSHIYSLQVLFLELEF